MLRSDNNRTFATPKLKEVRRGMQMSRTEFLELLRVRFDVELTVKHYEKIENMAQSISNEQAIVAIARITKTPISDLFEVRKVKK